MRNPSPVTQFRATAADGKVVPAIHTQPLYGSSAQQRNGFVFERHQVPPGAFPETIMADHCFAVPLGTRRVPITWRVNGRLHIGVAAMDRIFFRAAGDAFGSEWQQPLDALFVSASDAALEKILGDGDAPRPRLQTHLDGVSDAPLLHTLQALHAHIREHCPGGYLLNETLFAAIGLRLVDLFGHPAQPWSAAHARAHTSHALLDSIEDYIHARLAQDFSIADIAGSVNLSTFHLCKVFKKAKGISLWQYVLRCRIEYAIDQMRRHPSASLTEIALASGFESYTQFLAAFRKHTGAIPRQFRAQIVMAGTTSA
jgi:AraC-like DNA-binding protein